MREGRLGPCVMNFVKTLSRKSSLTLENEKQKQLAVDPVPPLGSLLKDVFKNLSPYWKEFAELWKREVVEALQENPLESPEFLSKDASGEEELKRLELQISEAKQKLEKDTQVMEDANFRLQEAEEKKKKIHDLYELNISMKAPTGHSALKVLLNSKDLMIEFIVDDVANAKKKLLGSENAMRLLEQTYENLEDIRERDRLPLQKKRELLVAQATATAFSLLRHWSVAAEQLAATTGKIEEYIDLVSEQKTFVDPKGTLKQAHYARGEIIGIADILEEVVTKEDKKIKDVHYAVIANAHVEFTKDEEELLRTIEEELAKAEEDQKLPPKYNLEAWAIARRTANKLSVLVGDHKKGEERLQTNVKNKAAVFMHLLSRKRSDSLMQGDLRLSARLNVTAKSSQKFAKEIENRNRRILWALLARKDLPDAWETRQYWQGCEIEERLLDGRSIIGFTLNPKQLEYLAYEQAILHSLENPDYEEIVSNIRINFAIPMGAHNNLISLLLPDGTDVREGVGWNPLDIRYRCGLLMNPYAFTDLEFVERQLWVVEQGVVKKGGRFYRPAHCLIEELRKRREPDEVERTFFPKDPLGPGSEFWEQEIGKAPTAYLAASLLKILTHIHGGERGDGQVKEPGSPASLLDVVSQVSKIWNAPERVQLAFCGPIWSVISDSTYDDYLSPDYERYAGIISDTFCRFISFQEMSILAASRIWHTMIQAVEDGDAYTFTDDALAAVYRCVSNFESFLPESFSKSRFKAMDKANMANPRLVLSRRILTAQFRDELIFVLKDYRKLVGLNKLELVIDTWNIVWRFVDTGIKQNLDPLLRKLLRWFAYSSGLSQTLRLLPEFDPGQTKSNLEEQEGILKYMTEMASCIQNLRNEIPMEIEYYSSAWVKFGFDDGEHIGIVVRAMRKEIAKHLTFIATPNGPWSREDEIAPGIGTVVNQVCLFEEETNKYAFPNPEELRGSKSLLSIVASKVDSAMNVRWITLDKEIIQGALETSYVWNPVSPQDNLLHSQGVLDLFHFVFQAIDIVEEFQIPTKLYGHTFLNFLYKLSVQFVESAADDSSHITYTLAKKADDLFRMLEPQDDTEVSGDEQKTKKKGGGFHVLKKSAKTTFIGPKKKVEGGPDINELIVRIRSLAFFVNQTDLLGTRFKKKEGSVLDEQEQTLEDMYNSYYSSTAGVLENTGQYLASFFAEKMIFDECFYMFHRVYGKQNGITMSQVLEKEKSSIDELINLMKPTMSKDKTDGGKMVVANDFYVWVAIEVANKFYNAWLLIILERMREEIPLDPEQVENDSDSLRVFAMDTSGQYYSPGEAVTAILQILNKGWDTKQLKAWAENSVAEIDLKIAQKGVLLKQMANSAPGQGNGKHDSDQTPMSMPPMSMRAMRLAAAAGTDSHALASDSETGGKTEKKKTPWKFFRH